MSDNPFRMLPKVDEVLSTGALRQLAQTHPHRHMVDAVRQELDDLRAQLRAGGILDRQADAAEVALRAARRLERERRPKLRRVINATGIVLHTNLGRAPMAEQAAQAAFEAARGYLNLEMDLESGLRSSRPQAIREWVCRLTGAESATAVNNNAAATVIALRALAQGKEVIISRGQLIEIGGSFRIPEIMAVSGAILREVGTTNITRLGDYEQAIGPATGALLRVHHSNYRIRGFTESVALPELVSLGRKYRLPVIDDIGSGALIDFRSLGFEDEPVAKESIAAGADLVLFSGDKLLGGPQAGIIAGSRDCVARIEKDPLMRAFRLDKMTLAALEATLRLYLDADRALQSVPTLRLLSASPRELRPRAEALARSLEGLPGVAAARAAEDVNYAGGGSLPDQALQTWVVELEASELAEGELAHRLRTGEPAVVARVRGGKLVLDLRTIADGQETELVEIVARVLREEPQSHLNSTADGRPTGQS